MRRLHDAFGDVKHFPDPQPVDTPREVPTIQLTRPIVVDTRKAARSQQANHLFRREERLPRLADGRHAPRQSLVDEAAGEAQLRRRSALVEDDREQLMLRPALRHPLRGSAPLPLLNRLCLWHRQRASAVRRTACSVRRCLHVHFDLLV